MGWHDYLEPGAYRLVMSSPAGPGRLKVFTTVFTRLAASRDDV